MTSYTSRMRTTTVPHKGTFEAQQAHLCQAQKSGPEVSILALLRGDVQLAVVSPKDSLPCFKPNPMCPALTLCGIQSLMRSPNACLHREGPLYTLVLRRAENSEDTVKLAQLRLVPPLTSCGETGHQARAKGREGPQAREGKHSRC